MSATILALSARPTSWRSIIAGAVFVVVWVPMLAGTPSGEGADSGTSQCVVCHTDAAKLKALIPPDPPPSEEGEG